MTFSIVARDAATGHLAVAAASRALAVGARVIHARAGVGAAASQARPNPMLGVGALDGLAAGRPVAPLLAALVAADPDRDVRQCHVVDAAGRTAGWTGPACVGWAGHRTYPDFAVAGNMLAGAAVLDAMEAAWRAAGARPFAERLLAALDAGEAAGGDKRGRQSAALRVTGLDLAAELDLRVDDHPDPLAELRRLWGLWGRG